MKKRAGARGKARWKAEKRWAAALAGLLALAVLTALMLTLPGFTEALYRLLGITQVKVPVVGTSDVPVAVHVIDVGQGDAVLLEDHGAFALVDAGPPEAADVVVEYLRLVGVQALDYVVMTHPHADHIGGMQKVSERFEVKKVLLPNFDLAPYPTTSTFVDLLALWLEDEVPAETAKAGQVWPLGQGSLSVVHAGLETDEEHNRLSLGVLFEGGGLRFLNTGDAEKPNERAMLEAGADVAADVFLAAHHGSQTSNSTAFIQAVAPGLVVVSCESGSYGHPHRAALEAYAAVGATVLRTDEVGSVVVKPNGEGGIVYAVENAA